MRKCTQDYNGSKHLMLPGCLNFFQNIDGKCEHNIKAAKPIMLEWDDNAKIRGKKKKKVQAEAEAEAEE